MATEYEVDRMVVRLVGNQEDYQKMLKDVEKQTNESAGWAERQGKRISSAFNSAFKTAQGMLSSVGSGMQKAGAASMAASGAITAPMTKAAMDFSEYGKSISDLVRQSEIAAKKSAELKKSLLSTTEAFKDLSKNIKITEEQAAVFNLMSERTGESVENLIKTIKVGTPEFEKWRKEAEKFGLVLTEKDVKSAVALAESWTRVKQAMAGMWTQVGAVVADRFKEFNDLIIGLITSVTKWIRENKELINTMAVVAGKLMYIGVVLTTIGTAIATVAALLGPLVAAIAAGAAAWLAWDTATGKFLRGGALDVWERFGESAKNAFSMIMTYGKQIIDYVDKVMKGVFDAIKAGNLELAVEIVWSGAKVAWLESLKEIDEITGERFGAIFKNLSAGNWKNAAEAALNEIVILWTKMLDYLDPVLVTITNTMASMWTEVVNVVELSVQKIMNLLTTAAQKLAILAAAVPGGGDLGKALEEFGGKQFLTTPEIRRRETEAANLERTNAQRARQVEYTAKIAALEERRRELEAEGRAAADDSLETEKAILDAKIKQAEAERAAVEAEAAKAEDVKKKADEEKAKTEKDLGIESRKQSIVEQYDPVAKFMRQVKELNALFKEGERGTEVYKKAIKDIKQELVESSFKVEVEFGLTGMDAVRKGTREEQELIENTLEMLGKKKAEEKAVKEVERRAGEAAEPEVGAAASTETDMLAKLERIAASTERLADRTPVIMEQVELA